MRSKVFTTYVPPLHHPSVASVGDSIKLILDAAERGQAVVIERSAPVRRRGRRAPARLSSSLRWTPPLRSCMRTELGRSPCQGVRLRRKRHTTRARSARWWMPCANTLPTATTTSIVPGTTATYELQLDDGSILRTRISRPVDRTTHTQNMWSHILRDQLGVSGGEFWARVRDSVLPRPVGACAAASACPTAAPSERTRHSGGSDPGCRGRPHPAAGDRGSRQLLAAADLGSSQVPSLPFPRAPAPPTYPSSVRHPPAL